MRRLLLFLLTLLLLTSFQVVLADDCVEVDIELPDTVTAGEVAEGTFELINCGDNDAVVTLDVEIDINGNPFTVATVDVPMGAGEVISREFRLPVPMAAAESTVTICITAIAGDAQDSDCATVYIKGPLSATGDPKIITFLMASEDDCVEIDLELPDTVVAGPGEYGEGYFELTNCGDEAATIELEVQIDMPDTTITLSGMSVPLGAGETISKNFTFPVPQFIPGGEYIFCVTATVGEAVATVCQTVFVQGWEPPSRTLTPSRIGLQNYPNPFNPNTTIYFELPSTSHVNLTIYNVLGQKVRTLKDEVMLAGKHTVGWNSTDDAGNRLSSGAYLYRLQAGDKVLSKKMLIVK